MNKNQLYKVAFQNLNQNLMKRPIIDLFKLNSSNIEFRNPNKKEMFSKAPIYILYYYIYTVVLLFIYFVVCMVLA